MPALITFVVAIAAAVLPVAGLKVETTVGGEPVELALGADGAVTLRVVFRQHSEQVARVSGPTVVARDGRVLATLGAAGRVDVRGFEKPLRLRGCTLLDEEGAETTLTRKGDLWLKPAGQRRFSLSAHVDGDFKRACPTALLLYRLLPLLVEQKPR